ncbi:hypothetical protein NBRC111894_1120 [Sporolactobacillus inulinus]|uniref:Uncharacterized protein n=1 Tax=Sporolactobacillus inulinus TaxID=2078 RepID=A0A4Y1Z967_9BACL|nr:hypothetical protein NBRC111894_1120 [Sporolactobacillus inulinus]
MWQSLAYYDGRLHLYTLDIKSYFFQANVSTLFRLPTALEEDTLPYHRVVNE